MIQMIKMPMVWAFIWYRPHYIFKQQGFQNGKSYKYFMHKWTDPEYGINQTPQLLAACNKMQLFPAETRASQLQTYPDHDKVTRSTSIENPPSLHFDIYYPSYCNQCQSLLNDEMQSINWILHLDEYDNIYVMRQVIPFNNCFLSCVSRPNWQVI